MNKVPEGWTDDMTCRQRFGGRLQATWFGTGLRYLVSLRVMLNWHLTAHAVESFALRPDDEITVHQKKRTRWRG